MIIIKINRDQREETFDNFCEDLLDKNILHFFSHKNNCWVSYFKNEITILKF